jgi:hypothetical protein
LRPHGDEDTGGLGEKLWSIKACVVDAKEFNASRCVTGMRTRDGIRGSWPWSWAGDVDS